MAIVLEQKKKSFSWFGFFVTLFLLAVIILGGYYLFFSPSPAIEIVIPPTVRSVVDLSNLSQQGFDPATFDPAAVVGSPKFRSLKRYIGAATTGALGRENPFQPF